MRCDAMLVFVVDVLDRAQSMLFAMSLLMLSTRCLTSVVSWLVDRLGSAVIRSVCLLGERDDGRERCASMSSDGKKNQELTTHEGLPHDILAAVKAPSTFKTSRDDPSRTPARTKYAIRLARPQL